ncbi:MAG: ATP-binding protein [candidate division Zixibacteria bacterium]|nr:ATP-binding protein [candidate division Zixibacteria bacterium]
MTGGTLVAVRPTERNSNQVCESLNLNCELELFYARIVSGLGFGEGNPGLDLDNANTAPMCNYCDKELYNSGIGLFICGQPGAGKTSVLAYLTYRIVKSYGVAVVAGNPELIDYWASPSRGRISCLTSYRLDELLNCRVDSETIDFLKRCATVDYLLIDDINRLRLNQASANRLENIIERRLANNLTTIVTSEESLDGLKYHRGFNRIARILAQMTRSTEIEGEPIEYELPFIA